MLALEENDVHVWYARTSALIGKLPQIAEVLQPDERARASRYAFDRDRDLFLLTRGALRMLLAAYSRIPPGEISFACGPRGKPGLAGQGQRSRVEFNVSHTSGMSVLAFTLARPVGIDVELIREMSNADGIVARDFAPEEIAAYQALPRLERRRGFFSLWTRKEAYIKALGEGLRHPLDSFAVSLEPDEARFLRVGSEPATGCDWRLHNLGFDPAYAAAVAVRGDGLRVRCQAWWPSAPGVNSDTTTAPLHLPH